MFPKELVLCSCLLVINYYLNRCFLSGLYKRLSSIISRHCIGCGFVTLFLAVVYKCRRQSHRALYWGPSGMFFRAATEGPAADVTSQLLYEFRVLLLYLLSKLLPRLDKARQVR